MSNSNRLVTSNVIDVVQTRLNDLIRGGKVDLTKVFYLGQVISSNEDPKNCNRIKVRIPLLDDVFYLNDSNKLVDGIGDDDLPWCLSTNTRNVNTPENGAIVLVALLNPKLPYAGRFYFDAFPGVESKDLFDPSRLIEESDNKAWEGIEEMLGTIHNNTPGVAGRPKYKPKRKKTNYKVGIRGKDKNSLEFENKKTTLSQNKGTQQEALLELTDKVLLAAKELELVNKSIPKRERPVFSEPLFNYLQAEKSLLTAIVTLLNSVPSLSILGIPNIASPGAPALASLDATTTQLLSTTKVTATSKNIKIN